MGIPTTTLVTSEFVPLANFHARGRGYPELPVVVLPHPFETLPEEEITRIADARFAEIMGNLVIGRRGASLAGRRLRGQ
ncbi:MAG: hypothetical protein HYX92_00150 [Chloroflexi bacterium]|nr:hypothetical protein [Chloroflexota bacterium]